MVGQPPLTGMKVLEFAGLAPGPFAGMLMADAGASVLRIDRAAPSATGPAVPTSDMLARHKASIAVDLKSADGIALIRELAARVDILIDPFRPGVLEKQGLGPESLCRLNPRLIYARMTGFRRDGKYADMAGHDINYLAVSGALSLLGRAHEKPHPPLNMLADFAGGGAMLFQGVLLAVISRQSTGKGQVVEANMVDGASYLATFPRFALKTLLGSRGRGRNLLDGGSPFYDTYETKDGKYMSVGALEPQFFRALIEGLGITGQGWEEAQLDSSRWPEMAQLFTQIFQSKTRSEWESVFDGTDACCAPVLEYPELETEAGREGDQRPAVTLKETPCLAVVQNATLVSQGQGPGVAGGGYSGTPLSPGQGGKDLLGEWMGWGYGKDFEEQHGGLVMKNTVDKSKL